MTSVHRQGVGKNAPAHNPRGCILDFGGEKFIGAGTKVLLPIFTLDVF
jgi:hypothetical protein